MNQSREVAQTPFRPTSEKDFRLEEMRQHCVKILTYHGYDFNPHGAVFVTKHLIIPILPNQYANLLQELQVEKNEFEKTYMATLHGINEILTDILGNFMACGFFRAHSSEINSQYPASSYFISRLARSLNDTSGLEHPDESQLLHLLTKYATSPITHPKAKMMLDAFLQPAVDKSVVAAKIKPYFHSEICNLDLLLIEKVAEALIKNKTKEPPTKRELASQRVASLLKKLLISDHLEDGGQYDFETGKIENINDRESSLRKKLDHAYHVRAALKGAFIGTTVSFGLPGLAVIGGVAAFAEALIREGIALESAEASDYYDAHETIHKLSTSIMPESPEDPLKKREAKVGVMFFSVTEPSTNS